MFNIIKIIFNYNCFKIFQKIWHLQNERLKHRSLFARNLVCMQIQVAARTAYNRKTHPYYIPVLNIPSSSLHIEAFFLHAKTSVEDVH